MTGILIGIFYITGWLRCWRSIWKPLYTLPRSCWRNTGITPRLPRYFTSRNHNITHGVEGGLMVFSVLVALAGIVLAWFFYLKRPDLPGKLVKGQWGFDLVENKYYVDEIYDETVVKPIIKGSDLLWKQADMRGVDGAVNGVAQTIGFLGKIARSFQSGFVRNYALIMVVGFIFLVIISQIEV